MSRDILLDLICADPAQPRKHFDDSKLRELADSMKANGLIVPILVRPVDDRYLIVHGERRYRAAKLLGWATIPAEVREIDIESARWVALVENIQRADLSPIEEATAYRAMLDTGITQTALGERIGKGQSYIAQKLRLLQLPNAVQEAIANGAISEGHARQLLRLKDSAAQAKYCKEATDKSLSVAALKEAVDSKLLADETAAFLQSDDTKTVRQATPFDSLMAGFTQAVDEIPLYELIHPDEFKRDFLADFADPNIADWFLFEYGLRYYLPRISTLNLRLHGVDRLPTLTDKIRECQVIEAEAEEMQRFFAISHLRTQRRMGEILTELKKQGHPV